MEPVPTNPQSIEGALRTAYVLFAHGSSVETANEAVREVAAQMARQGGFETVETAFLELGTPSLGGAIQKLARRVDRVIVVPYFLTMGIHLKRDLPKLVEEARQAHPHLTIETTPPLDEHPSVIDVLVDRAKSAGQRSA